MKAFPEGAGTYDWSACTGLAVLPSATFSNQTVHVAEGHAFWFLPASVVTNDAGKLVATQAAAGDTAARTFAGDVELDGTWYVNDSVGSIRHSGRLSGEGLVHFSNFFRTFTALGEWAFGGTVWLGQCGNDLFLTPRQVSGKTQEIRIGGVDARYYTTTFRFDPACTEPTALSVGTLRGEGTGGVTADGKCYGAVVAVVPPHAVSADRLYSAANNPGKTIHLVADRTVSRGARTATGLAHLTVGEVPSASHFTIYPGLDLVFTNLAAAVTLDYTSPSNVCNTGKLAVRGTMVTGSRLVARTPQMVPAEVTGWQGETVITGQTWRLMMDFDTVADCVRTVDSDWIYAPTGTIVIAWTHGQPEPGTYDILNFPADAPVADPTKWAVILEAGRTRGLTLVRTSTGLKLSVPADVYPLTFYVDSEKGDDEADGISPDAAWRTLERVNTASVWAGERVLFKRGGLWHGQLLPHSGEVGRPVTYATYGTGPKPILSGSTSVAKETDWEETPTNGLWRTVASVRTATGGLLDVGNIIFDDGATNAWKKWTLAALVRDYDFLYNRDDGCVYLKLGVNPAACHASVELALTRHVVSEGNRHDVVYDGLAVRYGGAHGFGGGDTKRIRIQNCDIYWIGGGILTPHDDGTFTRYGNGIEFWDASADNVVVSNRLWQIYDAALTDQSDVGDHTNLVWAYNTVWLAEYAYEHFNRKDEYFVMDVTVAHNTFVDSGKGWGSVQRPDRNGAPLMIWYSHGPTVNFVIRDNILSDGTCQGVRQTSDWHTRVTLKNNLWWMTDETRLFRLVNTFYDFAGLTALGWGEGSAFAEPRFVNAAAHDYRLRRSSPAWGLATDAAAPGAYPEPVHVPSALLVR